jgi:D-serine deaminase-like pyridoxal phosphate-dependent protein
MSILDQIEQPTLMLDEAVAKRNIEKMVDKVRTAGVQFRPHFKTHQSAAVGEWFRDRGVEKITVSSVDMAEYFADHGWEDILIAFSLNIRQINRIEQLGKRIHLGVLVENTEAVDALGRSGDTPFDVWIKVDGGANRTGVAWQDTDQAIYLIREIGSQKNLSFRGLLAHSGDTYHCHSPQEIIQAFRDGVDHLNQLRDLLCDKGMDGIEVSVGDTPGCSLCSDFSGIDELRPGNFVFYDAQQLQMGSCNADQIAVALACPVIAIHPDRKEVVTYGGAVQLSKDVLEVDGVTTYGLVAFAKGEGWGEPVRGAVVRSLTQEHGVLQFSDDQYQRLKIGDLVFVLPAHSCLTVHLMKKYMALNGDVIQIME